MQLRLMLGDECVERIRVKAIVVARHRHADGLREVEALERREIRRLLDEHAIAGVKHQRRDQRERLLRAIRDQQLVGDGRNAAGAEPLGDQRAEPRVALRRRVLKRAAADAVGERAAESVPQPRDIEQLRRRQPAGERDHRRDAR